MVEIVRRLYDEVNVHNMLSSQGFVDNGDQIVKTSRILININTLNKTYNSLYNLFILQNLGGIFYGWCYKSF